MISARFGSLWLVAPALISGLAMIGLGHVRGGGFVLASTMFVAAMLRLILPPAQAGGLVVRSRAADVTFLLGMAVALFVIVVTLDLRPMG
jgi:Protein of unknown function (DUF3017)